ncbi:hypothetical protein [Picosynechococcus sp. NKBG15041c]|uniref:hypothetical protein n=1 Tax=Picosynechococcus sp. NKBG15041c TaxID=1407650 RepID=UPI0011DD14AE|nr:hypothetical protein [Picosynechococcus sp. NKBG15041c]
MKFFKVSLITIGIFGLSSIIPNSISLATGFTDLANCFTAEKGDINPIDDLGECRLQFYASWGGGTEINLLIKDQYKVHGYCPGQTTGGTHLACRVNELPGEVRYIDSIYGGAYCAWRHQDSVAYCAKPYNHGR